MISHVFGEVSEKFANSVIIDVAGVGYEVQVANVDFDKTVLGEKVKLYTYHHVREQSQELFGFSSLSGKKLFELLITVQGVGPKAALAILSLADSEKVRSAIAYGDSAFIAKASGVGKKTADRVAVDLSDKVGLPTKYDQSPIQTELNTNDEALDALMALGYNLVDATKALDVVSKDLNTSERVRQALKEG